MTVGDALVRIRKEDVYKRQTVSKLPEPAEQQQRERGEREHGERARHARRGQGRGRDGRGVFDFPDA